MTKSVREHLAHWSAVLYLIASCFSAKAQTDASSSRADQEFLRKLVAAAVERTHHSVRYVSSYVRIPYPGGDVPADTGVCTDEVIRSYRAVGIDLQKEVHEDMCATSMHIRSGISGARTATLIIAACRT